MEIVNSPPVRMAILVLAWREKGAWDHGGACEDPHPAEYSSIDFARPVRGSLGKAMQRIFAIPSVPGPRTPKIAQKRAGRY